MNDRTEESEQFIVHGSRKRRKPRNGRLPAVRYVLVAHLARRRARICFYADESAEHVKNLAMVAFDLSPENASLLELRSNLTGRIVTEEFWDDTQHFPMTLQYVEGAFDRYLSYRPRRIPTADAVRELFERASRMEGNERAFTESVIAHLVSHFTQHPAPETLDVDLVLHTLRSFAQRRSLSINELEAVGPAGQPLYEVAQRMSRLLDGYRFPEFF